MKSLSITGDNWEGIGSHDWCIEAPSLQALDAALERLDAKRYTIVTISAGGECHMGIGGGDGRYVVYVTYDNWDFWNLLSRHAREGTVSLNAGGQEGDYPARQVVDLESARIAARRFMRDQQLEPSLVWEQQDDELEIGSARRLGRGPARAR